MALKNKSKVSFLVKTAVIILAAILSLYGLWGLWRFYSATNNPDPYISKEVITYSTENPDETRPNCNDSYTVSSQEPRQIEIKEAGISGCIQKVGKDQHGAIAVPDNIHLAGWYTDSVLPGKDGLSIIDGHVLGRYNDAIFANLKKVDVGDVVRVQMGDGSWIGFDITSIDEYKDADTMPSIYGSKVSGSQLVLITCDGNYDARSNSYDKRVVVRAKLIS